MHKVYYLNHWWPDIRTGNGITRKTKTDTVRISTMFQQSNHNGLIKTQVVTMKCSRRQGLSLAVDCCGQTERWTRDEMKLPHLLTEGEVVGEGATPSTPPPHHQSHVTISLLPKRTNGEAIEAATRLHIKTGRCHKIVRRVSVSWTCKWCVSLWRLIIALMILLQEYLSS